MLPSIRLWIRAAMAPSATDRTGHPRVCPPERWHEQTSTVAWAIHQVAEAPGLDSAVVGVVDEFGGHDLVAGKLQHRQGAEVGGRNVTEHLIADEGVERVDLHSRDMQADVQGSHDALRCWGAPTSAARPLPVDLLGLPGGAFTCRTGARWPYRRL